MPKSVSFDRVAEVYDETRGGLARGRRIAGDISPLLVPGPTAEVGVGTGAVAIGLTERGHRVAGVDISPAMLAKAQARLGPVVAIADAAALPFPDGAVANTVFVHVLHLVGDMAATIAEAARVLRPGGRLVAVHAEPQMEPDDLVIATAPVQRLRSARPDNLEAVRAAGAAAGLGLVSSGWGSPSVLHETPNALADKYQRRVFSWMWRLDDTTWHHAVQPVITALRALPDPDRPRRHVGHTKITVLERPAGI